MYKVHASITVSDPDTGRKIHRTVEVEVEDITRPGTLEFGIKVGEGAFLAGWDLKLRDVKVNPMDDARRHMAAERTHRTRGKGAAPDGHGGES